MRRFYVFSLIISGILTGLALIPGLPLVLTFMSLGIGLFVLFAAMNLFAVLLCLFPFGYPRVPRVMAGLISAVLLTMVFVLPGLTSKQIADQMAAEFQQDDLNTPGSFARASGAGIELIRPAPGGLGEARKFLDGDECGGLCQRFLHGGQFDWVRVVTEPHKDKPRMTVLARRGTADDCAAQQCFVYAVDDGARPALTLHLTEKHLGPRDLTGWTRPSQWFRLTAYDGPMQDNAVLWQQTQVRVDRLSLPTVFVPSIAQQSRSLLPLSWTAERNNALDPDRLAADLGLRLAPPMVPGIKTPRQFDRRHLHRDTPTPPTADTDRIASILDREGPMSKELQQDIWSWVSGFRDTKTLTDEQVIVLARVAKDARQTMPTHVDGLFSKHPSLRAVLLPWVFDEMERGEDGMHISVREVARALASPKIAVEELAPYSPRFHTIINNGTFADDLILSAGRYGFDPSNVLAEYYSLNPNKTDKMAEAICKSDARWYPALAPIARTIAKHGMAQNPQRLSDRGLDKALRFLARTGHRAEVADMIRASRLKNKNGLLSVGFAGPMDRDDHPWGPCRR